jgi:hypothetical protein
MMHGESIIKLPVYVDSLLSVRSLFRYHNCARELSLVQFVLSGCHAMPLLQYVLVVLSAGNYPSEFEGNGTSPASAVAKNVWRYTSVPQ